MDKLKIINKMYSEIWQLHKKYYHIAFDGSDSDWDALYQEVNDGAKKYEDEEMADTFVTLALAMENTIHKAYLKKEGIKTWI